MTVLVTGVAGFIGCHVADALLRRGEDVIGIDIMGDRQEPMLKQGRLARLAGRANFRFALVDIADDDAVDGLDLAGVDRIVHLAAQAGVRYSLENPRAYVRANLAGHVNLLEIARRLSVGHFVYASSSSVYGDGDGGRPLSVEARAASPLSLYGATKRADELMTHAYGHLHGLRATGLRFFTVYGPWGRPDMAPSIFVRAMFAGEPIPLFNGGRLARDFTYIDDIVSGVLGALDRSGEGHRLYNLGNSRAEPLLRFISVLEQLVGRKARLNHLPMQPGDVLTTCADITASRRDLGYAPATPLEEGLSRFVDWYGRYYGV